MKYDQLEIFSGIVGKSSLRIEVADVMLDKSWRKVNAPIDTSDLDQKWKKDVTDGAQVLLKSTYVKANDPHMDAKVFPHMHPYGLSLIHI